MALVGQHIAEPANRTEQNKNAAEVSDDGVGHQAGKKERKADGQHDRPGGGLGENDYVLIVECFCFWLHGYLFSCDLAYCDLTSNDVHHRENDDPDCIYKMPIERKHFDALGVFGFKLAHESEEQCQRQHEQADDDVKGMQAD